MKKRIIILILPLLGFSLFLFGEAQPSPVPIGLVVTRAGSQQSVSKDFIPLQTSDGTGIIISQKEKTFAPGNIEVKVGQAIEIQNDDSTVHNAYCQSGDFKYNSGPQQPGSKSRFAFATPGIFEVRCAIHPKMKLTVTVLE